MKNRGFRRAIHEAEIRFGQVAPTEPGRTLDLSHKGICFQCDRIPKAQELVVFLTSKDEVMELLVRQRWVREVNRLHHRRYRMGVEVIQGPPSYHRMVQQLAYH